MLNFCPLEGVHSKDPQVRYTAAEALGNIKDSRAVDPLIQALKDEDNSVRYWSTVALGKINDVRAAESLIQTSKEDTDNYVRNAAANVLKEHGWA